MLGLCLLAVLIALVKVLSPSEEEIAGRVKAQADKFKVLIDTKQPPPLSEIKYLETIRNNWETITPTRKLNNWLMYRQPVYVVKWSDGPSPGDRRMINLPPVFKAITPTFPDTIELNWLKNDGTTADVKAYRIYRKGKDDKEFARVIELPAEALSPTGVGMISYQDRALSPTAEYAYYITSYTDAKNVKDNKQESDPSAQMQCTTLEGITIDFPKGAASTYVLFKVGKYEGFWKYENGQCGKGEDAGKDKFFTILDITPFEIKVMKSGMEITEKRYKITYRNNKTGQTKDTPTEALPE